MLQEQNLQQTELINKIIGNCQDILVEFWQRYISLEFYISGII